MSDKVSQMITDAVTQVNLKVVGEGPAIAMGNIYQTAAHATGLMFINSVHAQNNQFMLAQAATAQGILQIYNIDTLTDAVSLVQLLDSLA